MDMSRDRNELYEEAGRQFAPAIARLARAYEHDPEKSRDLEQDIHFAIWRSLERFEGNASLKTWVYRVSHNVVADHVASSKRHSRTSLLELEDTLPDRSDIEGDTAKSHAVIKIRKLVSQLKPLDAQILMLWLEGEKASEIADICGLSTGAVQVRVHRAKSLLTEQFQAPSSGEAER